MRVNAEKQVAAQKSESLQSEKIDVVVESP